MKVTLFILLVAAGAGLAIWSRPGEDGPPVVGGMTMGGTWSVKLGPSHAGMDRESLRKRLQGELDRIESQMSNWREESELSQFNRYGETDWFPVSRELAEVVGIAREVSQQSDGAFDVTVAPLVDLWGFGRTGRRTVAPRDDETDQARASVGFAKLQVRTSPPALRKASAGVRIDLGAIGKGYACDRLANLLDGLGAKEYLITVGGENRARGRAPGGGDWRIGIETPAPDLSRIIERIELRDAAVSTSGDYRNFVEYSEQRYCHEIDPRTGRPVRHGLASVSVVHASGARADALATALMVLGPEDGYAMARRMGLAALFIERGEAGFRMRATPEFEGMRVFAEK